MLRAVLIAVDFSASDARSLGRAVLLRLAPGAELTLLHVVPRSLPGAAMARAEHDARKQLDAVAKQLARNVKVRVRVRQLVKAGVAAREIAGQARASRAELVMVGRGRSRAVRDFVLGSTAERVLRTSRVPVLVTRRPARPYRRPLLAADLDHAAQGMLGALLSVMPQPVPQLAVVHAYDAPFQSTIYPSLSEDDATDYREHYRRKALRGIDRLLRASSAELAREVPEASALSWQIQLHNGPARSVIEHMSSRANADLLVLGSHGYSGLAHGFLGSVAGDVLREVKCDVLVVAPRERG